MVSSAFIHSASLSAYFHNPAYALDSITEDQKYPQLCLFPPEIYTLVMNALVRAPEML